MCVCVSHSVCVCAFSALLLCLSTLFGELRSLESQHPWCMGHRGSWLKIPMVPTVDETKSCITLRDPRMYVISRSIQTLPGLGYTVKCYLLWIGVSGPKQAGGMPRIPRACAQRVLSTCLHSQGLGFRDSRL